MYQIAWLSHTGLADTFVTRADVGLVVNDKMRVKKVPPNYRPYYININTLAEKKICDKTAAKGAAKS